MSIIKKRALKIFLFSAAGSGAFILTLAGAASIVDATSARYAALNCSGTTLTYNGAARGPAFVQCGIDNHDGVVHSSASDLRVYVRKGADKWSADDYITAKACVRQINSAVYYCGGADTADWHAGYETLYPPLTYWTSTYSGYYAYVTVDLHSDGTTPDELTALTLWN